MLLALGKLTTTDNKNNQTKTEEFREEPTSPLRNEMKEGWPKVIQKPILIHPVTIQEQPAKDRYLQGYEIIHWCPVEC